MLHVLNHPLGDHLLTQLRDQTTEPATFRTLAYRKINIYMNTTSYIRITFIIDGTRPAEAVSALHDAFRLERAEL